MIDELFIFETDINSHQWEVVLLCFLLSSLTLSEWYSVDRLCCEFWDAGNRHGSRIWAHVISSGLEQGHVKDANNGTDPNQKWNGLAGRRQ